MAQLWGGRFTKKTDQMVYDFNASIGFDRRLYRQDIEGSMAHVKMLAKQKILTEEERDRILQGLSGILADVEDGSLPITKEYEDIHSFVEANLIDRIGDAGKKLHTGRSRNDQVALDMKLYVRRGGPEDGRAFDGSSKSDSAYYGGKPGYDHARIHSSSESTADHTGTSHGCVL